MAHKLWYYGLDGLSCNFHPIAQIDIDTETVREFNTEYLTNYGQKNRFICQYSVIGSAKFTIFNEIWGNSLPYISNSAIPDGTKGLGWKGTAIHRNNYTATGILGSSTNTSPFKSLRSSI